jgi:hypothetical protein
MAQPGTFQVQVTYACAPGTGGAEYRVSVGEKKVIGRVRDTGGWTNFTEEQLGTMELSSAGKYTLTVKPQSMPHGAVMNLKAIRLSPVR